MYYELEKYLRDLLTKELSKDNSILSTHEIEYLKGIYGIYDIKFDERKQK